MTAEAAHNLSADDLHRFCEFLHLRTGMRFGETKRYYIERRLFDRIVATGQASFAAYFDLLRTSPLEVGHVVSSFTVNETYFYREDHQFQCLSQDILPEIARRKAPGDKIRIWSQPCSTGEEAYSIALWLLENWRMVDAYNVEIIGSDIDAVALEAARAGRYAPRALSRLPEPVQAAYFEPSRRGRRQIIADLRESVSFTQANLMDRSSMTANGRFDVIFCRNVLIYFDDASRRQAADNLYACLEPGGFICLGHSESMSRISERFTMRRFPDAIVYQRPERN
jgi:chemotaxis protein methyltransferase CheR